MKKLFNLHKNLIVMSILVTALFLLGMTIGKKSVNQDNLKAKSTSREAKAVEVRQNAETTKSKIAFQDEIPSESFSQIVEDSGEVYVKAKDISELIAAEAQWNSISKQFMIKKDKDYIILDMENSKLTNLDQKTETIKLYGKSKDSLVPVGKVLSCFDYEVSRLDELGIFRVKNMSAELLDIEISKKYSDEFDVEIENYEFKQRVERAELEEKYPEKRKPILMKDIPHEKTVYLTFDDGPNQHTSKILDVLKKYDVKGTFFLLGNNISGKEDIVKRTFNEGHAIGLHSMSHALKEVYGSPESFLSQMNKNNDLVKETTGFKSKLIRPPYGSKPHLNDNFRDLIVENNYRVWDWNVDSKDALGKASASDIYENTISQSEKLKGPIIVLFHDKPATAESLSDIVEYFLENGYRLEPITEDLLPFNFWKDKRHKEIEQ